MKKHNITMEEIKTLLEPQLLANEEYKLMSDNKYYYPNYIITSLCRCFSLKSNKFIMPQVKDDYYFYYELDEKKVLAHSLVLHYFADESDTLITSFTSETEAHHINRPLIPTELKKATPENRLDRLAYCMHFNRKDNLCAILKADHDEVHSYLDGRVGGDMAKIGANTHKYKKNYNTFEGRITYFIEDGRLKKNFTSILRFASSEKYLELKEELLKKGLKLCKEEE